MSTLLILLSSTLRAATPLLLAALGGIFSERSGVVNIALDGIMLVGAWAAIQFTLTTGSTALGTVAALIAGAAIAGLHGLASIRYKANQVVSGVAINLLAAGFTEFMASTIWRGGQSPSIAARLPDIGPFNITVYIALALTLVSHFLLWHTPWGLRIRAVGEHPLAADTLGVPVEPLRYQGVLLSGVLAGLAGASLSVGLLSSFTLGMTSGRGFIALAAVIFGRWRPVGALWACLLFGAADALSTLFQIWAVPVPSEFLSMVPYLLTMLALAGLVGRSTPPAAAGTPYEKGGK